MAKSPQQQQIIEAVKNAGIIGAGGGGFPAHVKLQADVATVIANASECEPLLNSDCAMMEHNPELLILGMQAAMQAVGAKQGIIGIKAHYHAAVDVLQKALPKDGSIKLHFLDNYYPAGDEFLLVYEVTGKVIPEGGIPLQVGVVVHNVISLMQIAHAISGKPVTERAITLAGEFNEPKVVIAPIGTTYAELVAIGGGLKIPQEEAILIDGGPMMGCQVVDWNAGVSKTTSGILAFPRDHFVVRMANRTLPKMLKLSKSACCQCFRCSDLCPRNLLGHEIYPHLTMRTVDYNLAEPTKHITAAFLCSQCGVCELIACDFMLLSPRKIYAAYRKELVAKGIKNPHNKAPSTATSQFPNRKVSIPMLMKKIDIEKYNAKIPFAGKIDTAKVRISLSRHIGVPALPQVGIGQKVRMCDVIAKTPDDKLGAVYHASITGKITDISDTWIEITK